MDTANTTGWCLRACGVIIDHGEHALYTNHGLLVTDTLIDNLSQLTLQIGLPIVVVSERSWGGYMGTGRTTAFGYWLHALRSIGVPMKRIIEVYPSQWRAVVIPGKANAKREVIRPLEMATARALVNGAELGPDEAPAILIGVWGAHAGEVGAVL